MSILDNYNGSDSATLLLKKLSMRFNARSLGCNPSIRLSRRVLGLASQPMRFIPLDAIERIK